MKNYDLEYVEQGFFTMFYPISKAGEYIWAALDPIDGTGKIYTAHLKSTLAQLRKAGYLVRKAPKRVPMSIADEDSMLAELTN